MNIYDKNIEEIEKLGFVKDIDCDMMVSYKKGDMIIEWSVPVNNFASLIKNGMSIYIGSIDNDQIKDQLIKAIEYKPIDIVAIQKYVTEEFEKKPLISKHPIISTYDSGNKFDRPTEIIQFKYNEEGHDVIKLEWTTFSYDVCVDKSYEAVTDVILCLMNDINSMSNVIRTWVPKANREDVTTKIQSFRNITANTLGVSGGLLFAVHYINNVDSEIEISIDVATKK